MANILTVDDSNTLRSLLEATLTQAGHTVTQASDGIEGMKLAGSGGFELIISDLNMPNMDGLTLVRQLRSLPALRAVPILILTTELDPTRKTEAKDAGATGWIVKPFDPASLLATIRRVID